MSLWRTLTASPHRPLFLAGAIQAVLTMLWWSLILLTRFDAGAMPNPAFSASAAHGWLMLNGLFPLFVFGFLFTALPNWVEGGRISRGEYLATAILMTSGAALFYPAMYFPALAVPAHLSFLPGWTVGLLALRRVLRAGPARDKRQPWLAWSALLLGLIGAALFPVWLFTGDDFWLRASTALSLWGFLTPLFLAVCHRMVPWFTSRIVSNYVIVRPYSLLWAMVAASLLHGLLQTLELTAWTWLADLPLAATAFWFISRWGIARALPDRLLAMLHIGFVWGAAAFALYGLDSLLKLFGADASLGLAPLHALGIGFFGSMLLAMASRVSLGHSGRALKADGLIWALFWLVQATALLRMLPDLLPAIAPYWLILAAALLWLIAFGIWSGRHAPWYWRARADGKPG